MSSAKDDQDFWESSETRWFSFENNEVDQLFGVSKNDTDKLWAGIFPSTSSSEGCLMQSDEFQTLKPMLSVVSEKTISCILAADKLENLPIESPVAQPDITLRKILLGQHYSLEQYKSLASKTALLDAAITSGDGNAILIIILFLTKTLNRSLVQRILTERPEAVNIYIQYLSIRLQTNEITDLLIMMGQSTDAAMKNLHIIIKNTRDPDRLLQKLKNCYKTQFEALTDCKETQFVQAYIKLLEWQMAVKTLNNTADVELKSPVLKCLHYACKNHWNAASGILMSPLSLSQQHNISPREYQKVALEVKASASEWDEVDNLFLSKGWLGNKKLQMYLPVEDILKVMHKYNAPSTVLEKYFRYVDNIDKRLELAQSLCCYRVAIDIFVLQGDRTGLMAYKAKLQVQSEEYFYAESALRLPTAKWKN